MNCQTYLSTTQPEVKARSADRANRRHSFRVPAVWILSACVHAGLAGCGGDQSATTSSDQPSAASQREARELLDQVLVAYRNADAYHDDAKMIVRYRLEGRPMEEHQLWSIDFQRPDKLAARLFNARVQSDAQRTTVMVFDFDSENMDNQYLVLEPDNGIPWDAILGDSVSRHFIRGSTEIPFNDRLSDEISLPPTVGLLTGNPPVDWLSSPEQAEMLPDATVGNKTARRMRLKHERRVYELAIDPDSLAIVQLILPNQYLDEALLVASEITDLQLSVHFSGATFDPRWQSLPFSTVVPDNANPVRTFVPLPEPFPSEAIGKPLPPLEFSDRFGKPFTWEHPGATTVFAWVDRQDSSLELLQRLEHWKSLPANAAVQFQICFAQFPNPDPRAAETSGLTAFLNETKLQLPTASDMNLAAGTSVGVQFAPTVVIVDAAGVIQYFRPAIGEKWESEIGTAIGRVQAGENLASEMRAEYARFIDEYREKLRRLNPFATADGIEAKPVAYAGGLKPREPDAPLWSFADVKLAGNVTPLSDRRLLIHDGWRTIVEFDLKTRSAAPHALQLEPEMVVTMLRKWERDGKRRFLAFSEMGRQIVNFADDWSIVGSLVVDADQAIRDAQIADFDQDGRAENWIVNAAGELRQLDDKLNSVGSPIAVDSGQSLVAISAASDDAAESDSSAPAFLVVRNDGGIVPIGQDLAVGKPFAFGQLKIRSLYAGEGGELIACADALDERGEWQAVGINRQLEIAWTRPIGPRDFQRQVQSIARGPDRNGSGLWAFAASDNTISVFDESGQPIDLVQWPRPLHGLAVSTAGESAALIIADENGVHAISIGKTADTNAPSR